MLVGFFGRWCLEFDGVQYFSSPVVDTLKPGETGLNTESQKKTQDSDLLKYGKWVNTLNPISRESSSHKDVLLIN